MSLLDPAAQFSVSQKRTRDAALEEPNEGVKRRSTIACQACRTAKTKCDVNPFSPPCSRCADASIACLVPESRRGRMKGSKNRRTLGQMLKRPQETAESSETDRSDAGPSASLAETTESAAPVQSQCTTLPEDVLDNDHPPARTPGTITPLDPHNLMKSLDQDLQGNSRALTRKLMRFLGEQFPVGQEKEPGDSRKITSGFQDLLPSIINIAKQGWTLDEEAKRSRRVLALPTTQLPPEDAQLLENWTPQALSGVVSEMTRYFEYGLRGSKRDVAPGLDALQRRLITKTRAQELFDAFFDKVHPQWAMLDPAVHTTDFVQTKSALLMSTILALGSIALATLPHAKDEQVAEALKLHAHVEKLNLVIYSTGARSIEIVQAQILLSRFGVSSRTRLDEQRWLRSAMIPRMAAEIGLGSFPRNGSAGANDQNADERYWNDLRTRAFMVLNEYRFFTFSGRVPVDLSYFDLEEGEAEQITRLGADHPSSSLPALYHLYLFQKEVCKRLEFSEKAAALSNLQLEADLAWVTDHTQRWTKRWCDANVSPRTRWHLLHDALSCQLLLSSRITGKLPQPQSGDSADRQRHLLDIAVRIFQEALNTPQAIHMTHRASIFPFAGAIILRFGDRRDLVLRLALRAAGHPGRPHVPTFIRNAGNQLLAMLCANQGQPRPSRQPDRSSANLAENHSEEDSTQATCKTHDYTKPHCNDMTITRTPDPMTENSWIHPEREEGHSYLAEFDQSGITTHENRPCGQAGFSKSTQPDPSPAAWTPQVLHEPSSAGATAPMDLDFFNVNTAFDFPYVSTCTSPHDPLFTSPELVSDFQMLVGSRPLVSFGDMAQQTFDSMLGLGASGHASQHHDTFMDSVGMLQASQPLDGDVNGSFGVGQAVLTNTGPLSGDSLPVYASPDDGATRPSPEGQQHRDSIYYTIGRLLHLASSHQ